MAIGEAYWIDPAQRIHPVVTSHIAAIIDEPSLFGLTLAEIKAEHAHYAEKLRVEGMAREVLIRRVVERGFIRIRHHGNRGYNITIYDLGERSRASLAKWANQCLTSTTSIDPYARVVLAVLEEKRLVEVTLGDLKETSCLVSL